MREWWEASGRLLVCVCVRASDPHCVAVPWLMHQGRRWKGFCMCRCARARRACPAAAPLPPRVVPQQGVASPLLSRRLRTPKKLFEVTIVLRAYDEAHLEL